MKARGHFAVHRTAVAFAWLASTSHAQEVDGGSPPPQEEPSNPETSSGTPSRDSQEERRNDENSAPAPAAENEGAARAPSAPADAGTEGHALAVTPPVATASPAAQWPGPPPAQISLVPVTVTVTRDGTVTDPQADSGTPALIARAAEAAALAWRFEPARRNGQPIAARIKIPVRFAASTEPSPSTPPVTPGVTSGTAPPGDAAARKRAASTPEPLPEPHEVHVTGVRTVARPASASDYDIVIGELHAVPRRRADQLLTLAPGFFLSNHAGAGHAATVFVRGFDAGEGQDIEFTADGVPLNEPSNAHSHGYADTLFIIPELVERLHVSEGPFDPHQGDFAVAASAGYDLGLEQRGVVAEGAYGSFNSARATLLWGPERSTKETFAGLQFVGGDGFGPNRAHRAVRFMGRYEHPLTDDTSIFFDAQSYGARFESAGVIRLDDYEQRSLPCARDADSQFFCLYDPNQGGASMRHGASVRIEHEEFSHRVSQQVFVTYRDLRIRENFTGYVTDERPLGLPQRGDGVDQRYDTTTFGGRGHYTQWFDWLGHRQEAEIGYFVRHDRGQSLQQRLRTADGAPYRTDFDDEIRITNIASYVAGRLHPIDWLLIRGGVRLESLLFEVTNLNEPDIDAEGERIPQSTTDAFGLAALPRASLEFIAAPGLSVLASYGQGTRSSDAKGITEGDSAPFARVQAGEVGVAYRRVKSARYNVDTRLAAFTTHVDRDLLFDPAEGRNELIGESNRFGALWTGRFQLAFGLDVSGSVVYAEAFQPAPEAGPFRIARGERLPYVPRWVSRLDAALVRPFAVREQTFRYHLALGASYVGGRPLPFGQMGPPLFDADAAARLGWKLLELGIEVTNLTDRRNQVAQFAYVSNFTSPDMPASELPMEHFAAGAPRQFMGTLRVSFGPVADIEHPTEQNPAAQ